ncbi:hypothetical protein DPMN_098030 [Dreissena polymorpha]|uniref:Secreted protein n=1 Tax=Dreissena polymorpha TaxID=45954 RepID=A0A9D4R5X7_DREPO|nr:hypothetical protein DPMN_098030 [Dreissena polymorpha]
MVARSSDGWLTCVALSSDSGASLLTLLLLFHTTCDPLSASEEYCGGAILWVVASRGQYGSCCGSESGESDESLDTCGGGFQLRLLASSCWKNGSEL